MARKIQVLKSLVVSKPVYAASMVSISCSFVQETKFFYKEFIWNNRKSKIKHNTLIGYYAEGGLALLLPRGVGRADPTKVFL